MKIYNIKDMLADGYEDIVKAVISSFSCTKVRDDNSAEVLNPDIEVFLNNNAIQFAKMKTAITYFVFDEADSALLGFFTIAHKPLDVPADGISRKIRDKLKMIFCCE